MRAVRLLSRTAAGDSDSESCDVAEHAAQRPRSRNYGEMISSVSNLLVYGRALGTGKGLLRPKQQRERLHSFHPKIPPETATLSYGIGLVNDRGWIGHTGQVPGYTTAVYYRPDIDTTVVVEANSDIVSGSCPAQSTLIDDPITRPCALPADRIMGAVAASRRHPYQLPPG